MRRRRRGTRARVLPTLLVATLACTGCGGNGSDRPSPSPSRVRVTLSPTPVLIGTEAAARWAAAWKGAFQAFADDLSTIVQAIRNRDVGSLRDALGRLPDDARDALAKIDRAGPAPPGFEDEARRLRGLVGRAAGLAPQLTSDCLNQAGLACAADAANLLSVVGQMLDTLRPLGIDIRFRVDL